ncbi:MAG: phosphoesterase [Hahellaceae bacterium]|nr:phosphoesterase [Hahellaceae bacterium]
MVLYHGGGCLDGFASAYAAHCYFRNFPERRTQYLACKHGEQPPIVSGKDVYLVDFSYKREVMSELCLTAERVIVLDHHISAWEDLEGLDLELDNLELNFDMERSGAVITWEYFHNDPVPFLLACVQDRDLWRFRIPESKNLNAALMSYAFSFEMWDDLVTQPQALQDLLAEGRAINRFRDELIKLHKEKAVIGNIAGFDVPIVNAPNAIVSELLNLLSRGYPFAASYSDNGSKRGWSLRSQEDGVNVADIASLFGGGGHPRAAGFSTPMPKGSLNIQPR